MRRTLAAAAIVLAALAVPMEGARGPAVAFPRRSPPPVVVPSAAPASTPPLAAGTCVELAVPSPETDTVVSSRAVMALPPLRRAFVEQAARTARWVQRRTGIPASAGIAQAIWESGWGTNDLAAVYNLHAMKTFGRCDGRDTSPMGPLDVPWTSTREPRRGLEQCPYFRQYGSAEQGWLDWALRFWFHFFLLASCWMMMALENLSEGTKAHW